MYMLGPQYIMFDQFLYDVWDMCAFTIVQRRSRLAVKQIERFAALSSVRVHDGRRFGRRWFGMRTRACVHDYTSACVENSFAQSICLTIRTCMMELFAIIRVCSRYM